MTNEKIIQVARSFYCDSNNDIEIDDASEVLDIDVGYWVAAWVFVHKSDVGEELK